MEVTLTIDVHEEEGKYWGQVLEMPGCLGAGRTLDELKDSIEEAVRLCAADYPELFGSDLDLLPPHMIPQRMQLQVPVGVST